MKILKESVPYLFVVSFFYFTYLSSIGSSELFYNIFNIEKYSESFVDLRNIPSYEDAAKFNTRDLENPMDPYGRSFNYPFIWIHIMEFFTLFGDPYEIVGEIQIYLFAFFSIILMTKIESHQRYFFGILVCSPPVFLLLTRGNTDGYIFLLIFLASISPLLIKGILIGTSSALKIFPIFTIFLFLSKKYLPFFLGIILILPLLISTFSEIHIMSQGTPSYYSTSFGVKSIQALAYKFSGTFDPYDVNYNLAYLLFLTLSLLISFLFYKFNHQFCCDIKDKIYQNNYDDIFNIFGVITIFSFIFLSSWAYRIIFFLPVIFIIISLRNVYSINRNGNVFFLLTILGIILPWVAVFPLGWVLFNIIAYMLISMLFPIIVLSMMNKYEYFISK